MSIPGIIRFTALALLLQCLVANASYHTSGRLTQIIEPNRSIEYILDGVANRLTETITDNNQTTTQDKTYSYNSRDQLQQVQDAIGGALITYQYDANGNQISKTDATGTTNLVYGPRDRLLTITLPGAPPIAYSYNEAGLRDSQSQNGQTLHYLYDQTSLIAETNTTGDELARYTHSSVGPSVGLIAEARSGVQTYLHTDALSTPIAVTDIAGGVTSRYTWDTWGNLQQQTGISQQPFGFTGYQRDAQTGLHYAQQRYYDAEIGRFNRHDPFRGDIDTPLSLHRYLYANANPTIFVDPDGRAAVIGPAELEALGLAVENERGIIDPAQGVLALLRERGLEDLIETREIFTTNVARRTPFIGPEAVRQAVNLLAEASINDNPPMAFVVAESGDTPESVLKFARNFIGDTGGVSSRELTLRASTVDSLPGDVIDISFELQDALAGAQEAANDRFINKVANQFQEFRNKQSGFVSGSLAVSQFLVNAVADTETALAQSSLNPFTPLAPQPLRSNANVVLGAEIIAGAFGRVVTLGRLGSNVNATDDVFEVTRGGVGPVRIGQAAEAAIQSATGLAKNTQSFVVNSRNRIPDFVRVRDPVTGLPSRVIESKNVASQAFTRQLRDLRDLVGPTGRVDVALPPGARVTRPLQRAFDDADNPLFRIDIPQ